MKNLPQQLKGIAVATVFFVGLLYVQAWVGPTGIAPNNNVDAPINVGVVTQLKSGALGIDGLFRSYGSAIFDGGVKISTGAGDGKVLTSDATGNASWETLAPSSGGGGGGGEVVFSQGNIGVRCPPGYSEIKLWNGTSFVTATDASVQYWGVAYLANSEAAWGTGHQCQKTGSGGPETDPTVLTSVKDGVSWDEVTDKPTQTSSGDIDPTTGYPLNHCADGYNISFKRLNGSVYSIIYGFYQAYGQSNALTSSGWVNGLASLNRPGSPYTVTLYARQYSGNVYGLYSVTNVVALDSEPMNPYNVSNWLCLAYVP